MMNSKNILRTFLLVLIVSIGFSTNAHAGTQYYLASPIIQNTFDNVFGWHDITCEAEDGIICGFTSHQGVGRFSIGPFAPIPTETQATLSTTVDIPFTGTYEISILMSVDTCDECSHFAQLMVDGSKPLIQTNKSTPQVLTKKILLQEGLHTITIGIFSPRAITNFYGYFDDLSLTIRQNLGGLGRDSI